METNTSQKNAHDLAVLLQTIGRAVVTPHGIPSFGELLDREPAEAVNLIIATVGNRAGDDAAVHDLAGQVIQCTEAGNVQEMRLALGRLTNATLERQTNHCECYYLIGVAIAIHAINQARAFINLDTPLVLTSLAANDKKGGA
jgi:hypothetical protein